MNLMNTVDVINQRPNLVSCLMATYGRHSLVERAIGCFTQQDYPHRELIILNTHAVPLRFEASPPAHMVIYNEPCWSTLGDQRNRLLSLAQGEFIRTWDDDDIYLPHAISQGVQGLRLNPEKSAWKPRRSWYTPDGGKSFVLAENIHEPSITFLAETVRKCGYFSNSSGDEHIGLIDEITYHEGGFAQNDVGVSAGFCYVWGDGGEHISGTLNQKSVPAVERAARWRAKQLDVRLTPLRPNWREANRWYVRIEQAAKMTE